MEPVWSGLKLLTASNQVGRFEARRMTRTTGRQFHNMSIFPNFKSIISLFTLWMNSLLSTLKKKKKKKITLNPYQVFKNI